MDETSKNGEKRIRFKSNDDINGSSINGGGADRLSTLPDAILVEILSLLLIKSAAATSALAQRWRHLWTQTNGDLKFICNPKDPTLAHDFPDMVNHILHLLTSPSIRSFDLINPYSNGRDYLLRYRAYLEPWIRQICSRNPEKITVNIFHCRNSHLLTVPSCLFQCQSLKELVLIGGFGPDSSNDGIATVSLPNLEKLEMCLYDAHRRVMATLFKSCPSLESLVLYIELMEEDHFLDISAHNLKRLTLRTRNETPTNDILIDAPKLKYFEFDGLAFIHFVKNPSGLLEAWIALDGEDYLSWTLGLFRGISSVRALDIYAREFNLLGYLDANHLPIFHNLTHVVIVARWKDFLRLLQCFPNLEDIKFHPVGIEGLVDPVCVLSKLKRMELKIDTLEGCSEALLKFLTYILSEAGVLKRLLVNVFNHDESKRSKELKFCEDLFSHPRSSLTCKIEFSGLQRLSS